MTKRHGLRRVASGRIAAVALTFLALNRSPGADWESRFRQPPAEARIIKIIHGWPDAPAAQDGLIRTLSTQGFGGVVCNVSFTDYLQSDARWQFFVRAVRQARAAGFALWLYDEKGYPSGTAGGLTLRNRPEWEARGLLIADESTSGRGVALDLPPGKLVLAAAFPVRGGAVDLKGKVDLASQVRDRKLAWQPPAGEWHVLAVCEDRLFEGTHAAMSLSEHIPYPNLLQKAPTTRFLELTHAAYARRLGENLGRHFVATFTDEPSLMSLFLKRMPFKVLPWSAEFPSEFSRRRGYALDEFIPALVLDAGPSGARARVAYWQTVGELVSENFFGAIQDWCRQHGVPSGGHLLMEENLASHVPLYGDFFGCLRRLDAPSIDCLTSIPEQVPWHVARLAASAAALEKKTIVMCETSDHGQRYRPPGDQRPVRRVTPAEIRGTCNRLVAGGVNAITSYYSFDGLNDEDLRQLNQYVGRCCAAVTGGRPVCDVAVVLPTESLWAHFRPARLYANESAEVARIESAFHDVSESLFAGGREFVYIDSRALAAARVEAGSLVHGDLRWRVVVLPGIDTLPAAAWAALGRFVEQGGVVIGVGLRPANSEKEFPAREAIRVAETAFGPGGLGEPRVSINGAQGAGVFLPWGLAGLASRIIDAVLPPDPQVTGPGNPLRHTHRRIDGKEVYFVANDRPEPWSGKISFAARGPGSQWNPGTGANRSLAGPAGIELELPGYGAAVFTYAQGAPLVKRSLDATLLPAHTLTRLPAATPLIARGEFVREEIAPLPGEAGQPGTGKAWDVTGRIVKGQVDTFLFARFLYPDGLDLGGAGALVIQTTVPESQKTATQLLAILHEKDGADYLASTGRLLNAPGAEQTWVPLTRFQLAGWSSDGNGKLDPDRVTEIRIGWGGYFGEEGETVRFTLAEPRMTRFGAAQ